METFLYIVFFLSCIVLVVSVLLQPGKTDAGALFTSGVSKAALNPRGTQSVLSKLTIATATVFMLTALLLSLPALTGNVSVLQTQDEETPASNTNADTNQGNAAPQNEGNAAPQEASNTGTANGADEAKSENTDASKDADKQE